MLDKVKGTVCTRAKWPTPSEFIPVSGRSMKRIGILPLLLDGMLVHRRLLPVFRQVSFGGERNCESKESCPRTHHK